MIALTMIFVFIIYLYIAFKVCEYIYKKKKKKRYIFFTVIFFLLLPTWDVIVGKIYFHHLCKIEGGTKIYKHIKADGFLDTSETLHFFKNKINKSDIEQAKRFLDYGFKFYEVYGENKAKKTIVHFYKNSKGDVVYKVLDKPMSRYRYEYRYEIPISILFGINKEETDLFIENKTNKTVIQLNWLVRDGWVGRLVKHFLGKGFGEGCGTKDISRFKYKLLKGDFHE